MADPEITEITKRATIALVTARGKPSQDLLDRLWLIGYINRLEAAEADVEGALAGPKRSRRRDALGRGIETPAAEPEADR